MLDDHHAVPLVAELFQALQQPSGVAGMEAGRRLVEDVADADQSRADLGGEADPLQLAAGEGVGSACQGQIAQAHAVEELDPVDDLRHERTTDGSERGLEFETGDELADLAGAGESETS